MLCEIAGRFVIEPLPKKPQSAALWALKHRVAGSVDILGIDHPLEIVKPRVREEFPFDRAGDFATQGDGVAALTLEFCHQDITTIFPTRAPVPAILASMLLSWSAVTRVSARSMITPPPCT